MEESMEMNETTDCKAVLVSIIYMYSETCPNDHSHIATTCVHRPECYVPTKSPLKAVLRYLRKAATWLMRPTAITLCPK